MITRAANAEREMEIRLWEAAAAGDSKTIRVLALGGVDIDARNDDGFTAYNLATQHGHADTALTILAAREMKFVQNLGVDPAEFYKVTPAPAKEKSTRRA